MNILDIILLVLILVWGVFTGIRKGFVFQITSLLSIVLGTYLASCHAAKVGGMLAQYVQWNANTLTVIGFIVIFIAVFAGLSLLGWIVRKLMSAVIGEGVDKILGVLFSTVKLVLILGLLIQVFDSINGTLGLVRQENMDQSMMYIWIKEVSDLVFPHLREMIAK